MGFLGCVVDGNGQLFDGFGEIDVEVRVFIMCFFMNLFICCFINVLMDVGVCVINVFNMVGVGQCMGLFVGSGVGKSVLFGMMICGCEVDVVVVGFVGECGWEVKEFIYDIFIEEECQCVVVVVVFVDIFLLMCFKGCEIVVIIVEYFCDKGMKVFFLIDFFMCYVMVQCEIVFVVGELFVIKGYLLLVFVCLFVLVECVGNGSE